MVFPRMQSEVFLVWWVVEGNSRITTSFLALEAASVAVTAQEK